MFNHVIIIFRVMVQVVMISMWWEVHCWPSWMIMHSTISREIHISSLKTLVIQSANNIFTFTSTYSSPDKQVDSDNKQCWS